LGFAPVWFASPIAAHDERTGILETVRHRSIHAGNDIEGEMTRTTLELLCIGAVGVALYLAVWPIVEFLK
jgi:hypothetical protein